MTDRPISPLTASMLGKVLEGLTLIGIAVLLPRALGPADYGQLAIALSFVTIGSTATAVGGPALMARFLPALPEGERPAAARALAIRVAPVRLGWALGLTLAAVALALWDRGPLSVGEIVLACLALWLSTAATLLLQAGLGLGRVGAWVARHPLENAILVAGALALHGSLGSIGAIAALPLATGASLALALAAARALRGTGPGVPPAGAIRFARLQAASGGLTLLYLRGAVPIVALAAGAAEAADAAIALGVALAAAFAVLQLFVVSLPQAAARSLRDLPGAEAELRGLALRASWLAIPVSLICAFAAEPITVAVFGERYEGAAGALAVALGLAALAPAGSYLTQVAVLRLRPETTFAAAVAGSVIFAGAAGALVGPLGAAGGCAAAVAASATAIAVQGVLLSGSRRCRLAPSRAPVAAE